MSVGKRKKICFLDGNRTHELPNTGSVLYSLSNENLGRARPFKEAHNSFRVFQHLTQLKNSKARPGKIATFFGNSKYLDHH